MHLSRAGRPQATLGIIGAGLSGLVLGRLMQDQGWAVQLIEKARGPGGRMATRRAGALQFDHGAQYFTARSGLFKQAVAGWQAAGWVQPWDGRVVTVQAGHVRPAAPHTRYVGVPRMSALTRALSEGLSIRYQTRITQVTQQADRWHLLAEADQTVGGFDAVVLTPPPAQAQPLLAGAPELQQRTAPARMQPCWAVMVAFDGPLDLDYDAAFVEASPLGWIARNNSKPDRPAQESWVLHASAVWSDAHLEQAPEAVAPRLLQAFFEATGHAPAPTAHVQAHRWRYALATQPLAGPPVWDPALRLGVCGDWCHTARVEGAYLSAHALAETIGPPSS